MDARLYWLVVLTVGILGCGVGIPQANDNSDSVLEVRLASTDIVPGFSAMLFEGDTVHIAPEPVVSDEDWQHVRAHVRGEAVVLSVQCTNDAAERLRSATRERIGELIAVLWQSEVRSVSVIRSEVSCSPAELTLPAVGVEGAAIAETVRGRWPETSS